MDQIEQQNLFASGVGAYFRYRIPALITCGNGIVLVFAEARQYSGRDSDQIDLLLRRSVDGGQTFDRPRLLVREEGWVCGNPAPVWDRETGMVWLLFCKNRHDQVEQQINQGHAQRTVWAMSSLDHGETWTRPDEITADVKLADWGWYATGPGHGIQLQNGRLLIPCNHGLSSPDPEIETPYFSHIIVSDDHGQTWKLGGSLLEGTNECVAVETGDGRIYLNSRNAPWSLRERCGSSGAEDIQYHRGYAWSSDRGDSFSLVKHDPALPEPICQASLCRVPTMEENGGYRFVFSNPASNIRENMTVRLSYDECRTWSIARTIHHGPSGYSDLCALEDGTILCSYERGESHPYETLTLARLSLSWLEAPAETN